VNGQRPSRLPTSSKLADAGRLEMGDDSAFIIHYLTLHDARALSFLICLDERKSFNGDASAAMIRRCRQSIEKRQNVKFR